MMRSGDVPFPFFPLSLLSLLFSFSFFFPPSPRTKREFVFSNHRKYSTKCFFKKPFIARKFVTMSNKMAYQSLDMDVNDLEDHDPTSNGKNSSGPATIMTHHHIHDSDSKKFNVFYLGLSMCLVATLIFGFLLMTPQSNVATLGKSVHRADMAKYQPIMHISDTHVDFFFDPTMSMQSGVCHSCSMSTSVHGKDAACPTEVQSISASRAARLKQGYSFGRYGCNPPEQLWESLHQQMAIIDPDPKVV